MKTKFDLITQHISNRISEKYPELVRFSIKISEESLYFEHKEFGFNRRLFVGLGITEYPKSMIVQGGYQCWLENIEVEELLHNLSKQNKLHYQELNPTIWFNNYTVSNSDEVWDSFKKYWDIDLITNPDVLDALCNHYIEVIGKHFIPFWQKYSDLQYINDEIIDKVDNDEIHHYLSGMTPFKKLIIMRFCKNKEYEIYKGFLHQLVIKAVEEDSKTYLPYKNLFDEMVQIIESKY